MDAYHRISITLANTAQFEEVITTLNLVVGPGRRRWTINKPVMRKLLVVSKVPNWTITRRVRINKAVCTDSQIGELVMLLKLKGIESCIFTK